MLGARRFILLRGTPTDPALLACLDHHGDARRFGTGDDAAVIRDEIGVTIMPEGDV